MRIHYIKISLQGIFLWLFFVWKVSVYLCPYLRPYYHESVKMDFPFISWNDKNIEYLTRNICYGYDHNLFPVWTFSQAKRHCDENLSFLTGSFFCLMVTFLRWNNWPSLNNESLWKLPELVIRAICKSLQCYIDVGTLFTVSRFFTF